MHTYIHTYTYVSLSLCTALVCFALHCCALQCFALRCFGLWVGVLGGGGFGRGGGWGGQQSRVTVAFGHGSFAFQGVAQGRIACICDPWVRPGMEYRAEAWGGSSPQPPSPPRFAPTNEGGVRLKSSCRWRAHQLDFASRNPIIAHMFMS